jgi:hypothetical protein
MLERLRKDFRKILSADHKTAVSAYSQIAEIIHSYQTENRINNFLNDPLWEDLEASIAESLRDLPPLCFYVDGADDGFERAPMYWLQCQLGLFYETMRFLRDPRLGGRLHLFVCLRDLVLSSVYQSEHRTRYTDEPHIRVLNWNWDAISYLFRQKVKSLEDQFFTEDPIKNGKTIQSWLGLSTIRNRARSIAEPIEQYLIRHTRLLPRDVIILGNRLCQALSRDKIAWRATREATVREIVADTARFLGDEQLQICGNFISSNSMPSNASRYGYSELFTGNQQYLRNITDDVKELIKAVGVDPSRGVFLMRKRPLLWNALPKALILFRCYGRTVY